MKIRKLQESELNQAAALANKVFCSEKQGDMGAFFPTLFRTGLSHSYGAFDQKGNLVSFMGLVPLRIISGTVRIDAFSVGAVCTDPSSRGLGLAGELLQQCREHALRAGASLLFISGDRSLYTRAGSMAYGGASKFVIKSDSAKLLEDNGSQATVRDMLPEDIFTVHDLLQRRPATIDWSIQELQQFIGSAPLAGVSGLEQHIRVAESPVGQTTAMAVFAVPMDREIPSAPIDPSGSTPPTVTTSQTSPALSPTEASPASPTIEADVMRTGQMLEWAGDPEALPLLIADAVSRYLLDELTLILPWQDTRVSEVLQQAFQVSPDNQNNAGTVMIVDAAALITQVGLAEEDGQPDKPTISVLADSQFEFHTGGYSIPVDGGPELCSLLFDPDSPILKKSGLNGGIPSTVQLPYMYGLYFI